MRLSATHLHFSFTDEFEERVSPAFVRKIQGRLQVMKSDAKSRNFMIHSKERAMEEAKNQVTLLMDTKFSFAVRFPFNPSNINFAELEVRFEILHTIYREFRGVIFLRVNSDPWPGN